jgi:hypothetical protein
MIAAASIKTGAIGLDENSPQVLAIDNRDNRNHHIMHVCGHGHGHEMQCSEYPIDPNGFYTFHKRTGHPTE